MKSMNNHHILLYTIISIFFIVYTPVAFGHGLGLDTISSVLVDDREISITVEIPSYYDETSQRQIIITAQDKNTNQNISNVTYLIGLFHDGQMLFRNYFFAENGNLSMSIKYSTENDTIQIHGQKQDSLLGAWYSTPENPLEIIYPAFDSGGLYTFEIEVRTIDEPTNIIEGLGTNTADVTIFQVSEFVMPTQENNDVKFGTKSYFDTIDSFNYDPNKNIVTFEMPFDWSEKRISHIPVVHVEVHFPKDFTHFSTPSYLGKINNIELFKSSITIDDYTESSERIVHFILLQDHLKYLKNQLKQLDEPIDDKMIFTLETNSQVDFPISAWTRDESFQVDLSWDPLEIIPEQTTKFIFTIRDGATAEPLRNSNFDFIIIQNGKEIHRESGNAQVGGYFIDHAFTQDQTGPTVIRFENIRGSGQSTEFGIVVAPEFGLYVLLVLVSAMTFVILSTRKHLSLLHSY